MRASERGAARRPEASARRRRLGVLARRTAVHSAVILMCAVWLVPTLTLIVTSLRPADLQLSSGWWNVLENPGQLTLGNFDVLLQGSQIAQSFVNSLVVTLPVTVATVTIGSIAGYALAWIPFRGERVLLLAVIALLALPIQVTLVPVLQLFASLGLAGTFPAAWIAFTAFFLPFVIYVMRNFYRRIPAEVFEAAKMDGASAATTWFRIAFPLAAPAAASVATLVFVWTWNDLLIALVYLGAGDSVAPMPVVIANLIGSQGQGMELLAAGAVVSMLLPVAVFFALQRYFVGGMVAGAVKG